MLPKISGCLIVKNEEENLPKCLTSLSPFVDELIIVDTGSTDLTRQVAQEFTSKLFHFDWCDDFAAARNFALEKTSGEWILTLDADEELIVQDTQWRDNLPTESDSLVMTLSLRSAEDDMTAMLAQRLFRNSPRLRYQYS